MQIYFCARIHSIYKKQYIKDERKEVASYVANLRVCLEAKAIVVFLGRTPSFHLEYRGKACACDQQRFTASAAVSKNQSLSLLFTVAGNLLLVRHGLTM